MGVNFERLDLYFIEQLVEDVITNYKNKKTFSTTCKNINSTYYQYNISQKDIMLIWETIERTTQKE